jgi:cobalt-zinc-cadmium efflux system outer membrane protein
MHRFLCRAPGRWLVALGAVALAARADAAEPSDDAQLAAPLTLARVVRAALARNPTVRAAHQRAEAMRLDARAEGAMPAPEAMAQVWQVPFSKPYALDTQMVMFGVSQRIPAPGSLGARKEARDAAARGDDAMADDRARLVARDAAHAFAEYVEASARHRIHREHLVLAQRVLELTRARQVAGGSLVDVTQAEVEASRMEADVLTDAALHESARAKINALLARAPDAALGEPVPEPARVPEGKVGDLIARARATRPELRGAQAERDARAADARAADREATWPSWTVAALYFAPTQAMPEHGYGFNASMTLPWLWGAASRKAEAARAALGASSTAADGAHIAVDVEVASAAALASSAARRLEAFETRVLAATQRAFDAAWSGYESARSDLLVVLAAERALVDAKEQIVVARAALDHALADLDAAVGAPVPRVDAHGGSHE